MKRVATHRRLHRKGTVVPLLIATVLLLMLVAAWVIDRAWVSSAYGEMVLAAESAAHAGAVELLDDTRLLGVGEELRMRRARYAAAEMAASNRVAGSPIVVDLDRDVAFAKKYGDDFRRDVIDPRAISVACGRSNDRGNRLGLLLSGIGGVDATDIEHVCCVRLENRIAGLHADEKRPLPLLPLGILQTGTDSVLGWDEAITQQLGTDLYSIDPDSHEVREGGDGLTEIEVVVDATADANGSFVSYEGFEAAVLQDMVENGLTSHPIRFDELDRMAISHVANSEVVESFRETRTLGRERVLFLTDADKVVRVVAGRVMAVDTDEQGRAVAIVQPCVLSLGQAIVAGTESTLPNGNIAATYVEPNPYLFKLITVR